MDFKMSDLVKPFDEKRIEWRAGSTNADKTSALALAYVDSRTIMERLDEVVGAHNWQDDYKTGPSGGVLCGISIKMYGEWITKWDGADNSDFEAVKGGLSDAFKRAAVKWGIGRYLYDVPASWVPCEAKGKSVVLKSKPKLPAWALPQPEAKQPTPTTPPSAQPKAEPETNSEPVADAIHTDAIHNPASPVWDETDTRDSELTTEQLIYRMNSLVKVKSPQPEQVARLAELKAELKRRNTK